MSGDSALAFSVVIGVVAGYGHANEGAENACDLVAGFWQLACEHEFAKSGIVVGGIVTPALTIYSRSFGCPDGGEKTALVQGSTNPHFLTRRDFKNYRAAVTRVVDLVRRDLKQSTALLTFTECAATYMQQDFVLAETSQ